MTGGSFSSHTQPSSSECALWSKSPPVSTLLALSLKSRHGIHTATPWEGLYKVSFFLISHFQFWLAPTLASSCWYFTIWKILNFDHRNSKWITTSHSANYPWIFWTRIYYYFLRKPFVCKSECKHLLCSVFFCTLFDSDLIENKSPNLTLGQTLNKFTKY